jgi:hypothetical protein
MRLLSIDRKRRNDAHRPAAEPFVVARLRQRPIEAGRLDLERVRLRAAVERRVDMCRNALAQREVDAVRRVDDER